MVGWRFETFHTHKIVKAFKNLIEFGIFAELMEFERLSGHRLGGGETESISERALNVTWWENEAKIIDLYGSIQTLFYLWGIAIVVAGVVALIEFAFVQFCRKCVYKQISTNLTNEKDQTAMGWDVQAPKITIFTNNFLE
ncbi:hypothetical protein Fcan01_20991 [Folsomia candida]|uniref:Uncharacterized protein n=1 Tax=Folsomia candida TaxID=158441 RepID=A0A226DHN8_FOLCA|nr:hypothetical protein Fcan01_20991 [Folsomia candida]